MKQLLLILFIMFSATARSQMQVGGRIGTGFTNLEKTAEYGTTYTWRQGLYAGLLATFKISDDLFLQPELNFSSEGGSRKEIQKVPVGTYSIPGTNEQQPVYANLNTSTIIHYLEVPVLAKLVLGNRLKYYVTMGPYCSFMLSAKQQAKGTSTVYLDSKGELILKDNTPNRADVQNYFEYETDIRDKIRKTNFGFLGGFGLSLTTEVGTFYTDCRLKIGATNINAHNSPDGKHQTTCFSLSGGYLITLHKKAAHGNQ